MCDMCTEKHVLVKKKLTKELNMCLLVTLDSVMISKLD